MFGPDWEVCRDGTKISAAKSRLEKLDIQKVQHTSRLQPFKLVSFNNEKATFYHLSPSVRQLVLLVVSRDLRSKFRHWFHPRVRTSSCFLSFLDVAGFLHDL